MKTLLAFAATLVVIVAAVAADVPIDTTGPMTLPGLLTQSQCSTFSTSALFSIICGSNDTSAEDIACNKHCQCAHGAIWGQCQTRPPGSPVKAFGINELYCACNYDTNSPKPSTYTPYPINSAECQTFYGVGTLLCVTNAVYNATDIPAQIAACTVDCVCAHSMSKGVCQIGTFGLGEPYYSCVCQ